MDEQRILERELYQIEQIRQLESEELQVEEVDDDSDDDDLPGRGHSGAGSQFTFDTCLASLHTYLGEVEDTHHRLAFLDGGAILTLPLFYIEGVVLFPEATLPLRVIQPNFIAAVDRALGQVQNPYTIGVLRVHRDMDTERTTFANIGTTAEIRQYRRLEDGTLNVVTRGQQRFRLRRRWIDVEGSPCGEVQIIQEDLPLRTPRDVLEKLPPLSNRQGQGFSNAPQNSSHRRSQICRDDDNDSVESFESELSLTEKRMHQSAIDSCYGYDLVDESTSSDEEKFVCESEPLNPSRLEFGRRNENTSCTVESMLGKQFRRNGGWKKGWLATEGIRSRSVSRAFLPYWVYRMYDSYCLAQKAADMWKQIVGQPIMEGLVNKPDVLSFYIASKIPVSESTRQELLEIDGITYRLRKEIEILEGFDRIRCRNCQTVIARRSDMLVMSTEGPLGAYVNPHGYVHEVMTLYKANGIALLGNAVKEYSWFPGYAWTIANCSTCETQLGWRFTATNRKLKPKSFWGIRSSKVADDMR